MNYTIEEFDRLTALLDVVDVALTAIATGACDDPATCAREALGVCDSEFKELCQKANFLRIEQ